MGCVLHSGNYLQHGAPSKFLYEEAIRAMCCFAQTLSNCYFCEFHLEDDQITELKITEQRKENALSNWVLGRNGFCELAAAYRGICRYWQAGNEIS